MKTVYEEMTQHKDFSLAVRTLERIFPKAFAEWNALEGHHELYCICERMMQVELPKLPFFMSRWICNNYVEQQPQMEGPKTMSYDLARALHFANKLQILTITCPVSSRGQDAPRRISFPEHETKDAIEQIRLHLEKLVEQK